MTDKVRLLVVDDSPSDLRILMSILSADYAVMAAISGEECIAIVAAQPPDLVLLDVTMAPLDGYQTCEQLRAKLPDLPVIFVSANTETAEILKGFKVGGQDYITKPFEPEILKSKVKLTLKQMAVQKKLSDEKRMATELVMSAMSSASDINIIVNFLRNATKVSHAQDLVKAITDSSLEFGLNTCAQIIGLNDEVFASSSKGAVHPLEQELMSRAMEMDERIMMLGNRMIIYFDSVVLLVKNMPAADSDRAGELKDYLMILVENAHDLNQKVKSESSMAEARVASVLEAIRESRSTLSDIEDFQKSYKEKNLRIMDQLMIEMESNYLRMGLTEEQEQVISSIIQTKLNESIMHLESGLQVDRQLHHLIEHLDGMIRTM